MLVQTKQNYKTNSNNRTRLEMDDKTTQKLNTYSFFYSFFFPLTSTGAQDSPKEQNSLQHLQEKLNKIQD